MQCSRCGAPHTPEHALIVVGTRLLCAACLAAKDATSFPEHDGWVPPFDLTMPPYHPICACVPSLSRAVETAKQKRARHVAQALGLHWPERNETGE
jgi:hypothetical protein